MPLVSQLFRGDPVFERCLVEDQAHITPGSRGAHVNKIQTALFTLDGYVVVPREVQSQTYGTSTANGVLAYKRKRGIINRNYQAQADDIVGKMTIASIDAEMARVGPKPQTVKCFPSRLYPSTRLLLAFAIPVSDVSATNAATATPLTPDILLDQARQSLPLATTWCQATLNRLREVRKKIERFHVYSPEEIQFFEPIQIHFKVNIPSVEDTVARDRIDKIIELYRTILQIFATGTSRMVGDPNDPNKALADMGGFTSGGVIRIGRDFANSNSNMRAAVLIHEGGHFADADCSHAASELPAPNGTPIDDKFGKETNPAQKNYAQLDFDLSIRNAYSVAQCAMHNGLGFDKRPP
jgi:hypothetical protein